MPKCSWSQQQIVTLGFYDSKTRKCNFPVGENEFCDAPIWQHHSVSSSSATPQGNRIQDQNPTPPIEPPPPPPSVPHSRGVPPLASKTDEAVQGGSSINLITKEDKVKEKEKEKKIPEPLPEEYDDDEDEEEIDIFAPSTSGPKTPKMPKMYLKEQHPFFISIIEDFLPPKVCEEIIAAAKKVDTSKWENFDQDWRRGQMLFLNDFQLGSYKTLLQKRIETALDAYKQDWKERGSGYVRSLSFACRIENFQLNRYPKGKGMFHAHADNWNSSTALRMLSFVIYLNTVKQGGETRFLDHNVSASPRQGTIVIFPSGNTHFHEALVPVSDDKWAISGWINMANNGAPTAASPFPA